MPVGFVQMVSASPVEAHLVEVSHMISASLVQTHLVQIGQMI